MQGYRLVAIGFPFEAIRGEGDRDLIMRKILSFLMKEEGNGQD